MIIKNRDDLKNYPLEYQKHLLPELKKLDPNFNRNTLNKIIEKYTIQDKPEYTKSILIGKTIFYKYNHDCLNLLQQLVKELKGNS